MLVVGSNLGFADPPVELCGRAREGDSARKC